MAEKSAEQLEQERRQAQAGATQDAQGRTHSQTSTPPSQPQPQALSPAQQQAQQDASQMYDAGQHRQEVTAQQSVFASTRAFAQGVSRRLQQIAAENQGNDAAVREQVRTYAQELQTGADEWAGAVIQNTAAKEEKDPNAAKPVPNRINV